MKTINIDGVEYVEKGVENITLKDYLAEPKNGLSYVLVRTYSAGVHCGFLKERKGKEVVLVNARRLYYWDGAFTLSTVATKGVSKPENCKFPDIVPEITLTEAIEIIPMTKTAKESIDKVPLWENS